MRWLEKRPGNYPKIHGIAAYQESKRITATVSVQPRPETEILIIDLPAGISPDELHDVTYNAGSILIPILPSEIDVFCASRFIAELLLVARIDRRDCQLAVVANRTRQNTRSREMLLRFLTSLKIPVITEFRDSQNFVHAAANGICIYDLPAYKTRKDIAQMDLLVNWLDQWRVRRLDAEISAYSERIMAAPLSIPARLKDQH